MASSELSGEKMLMPDNVKSFVSLIAILLSCLLWLHIPAWAAQDSERVCFSDDISFQGNRFFDTRTLLSTIQLAKNSSSGTELLEKDIDRLLSLYEENGFPYCQISPSHFRMSQQGKLSFSFLVEEGPRVRISDVHLQGLKTTKRDVILRELGTDILGFFSQNRVNEALRRVSRLSYIKGVEGVQLLAKANPEEGILKISLVEAKNNTLSGIIGYAPSVDGKGGFHGKMDLVFDNIFGTGRMIKWNWSKKDPHSSDFFCLYREPWLLGLPPTLELKFSQTDYDSTYLKMSLSARLMFNPEDKVSWGLQGGWEKVAPGTAGEDHIPFSRKLMAGIVLSLDLLDLPENPRKGLHYTTELDFARKRNNPISFLISERKKADLLYYSFDLHHYLPSFQGQTLYLGLHLKGLNTDEQPVPISEQFKLGGINSIRGYREEEFRGTHVAWVNLEYRFLLGSSSRIFLFFDHGYFERSDFSRLDGGYHEISKRKSGYGFGLRLDSKLGLLGIDYGLGEEDGFSQGKIHFGITNRF
jgi:outer membrane protein assembly factor BamA